MGRWLSYRSHDGQLWFPPAPPAYIGGPSYEQPPPHRPASANPTTVLPLWTAHFRHTRSRAQFYLITIGHSTLAARISHHLRATSRARSFSPLPALSQSLPPQPTQVEVEVLAPKPMPSPKLVSEDARRRPIFTKSRVETRTRSLSVVKLEEMTARTAAEKEAKAAVDKTLPAPPVPFGKPLGQAPKCQGCLRESASGPETPLFAERGRKTEDSDLDALERRIVEQVGTRKYPPTPTAMADPSPPAAPVPAKAEKVDAPPAAARVPVRCPGPAWRQQRRPRPSPFLYRVPLPTAQCSGARERAHQPLRRRRLLLLAAHRLLNLRSPRPSSPSSLLLRARFA
ncbi:hypothetical protein EDB85DRAFT_2148707 [Lactarius pseudohatsudake]|nr:hypothetical protein EDB85DRAFT_2148707 [Lactarius pseudohatsudake]